MESEPAGSPTSGWVQVRDRVGVRTFFRMALGFTAVLIIVLAGLALLNSFFVDLAPGQPDPNPGGGDAQTQGDHDGGGGDGPECQDFERGFQWTFILFTLAAVALFAVAILRREHTENRIGTSLWGILAIVAAFLAVLTFGAWRVMKAICDNALTCGSANDGTYTAFLFLLVLTLVAMAAGIVFSHVQRRNFLGTGWGLLGLLMYLPTVLTGFAWFTIRTLCTPELSCALRDDFLGGLATVFWSSLGGTLVAVAAGLFVQKRFRHTFFKSGWGVLAIALGLLAVFSGGGWLYVDGITVPGCDEFEIEEPELQTCEEIRDDLQSRIGRIMIGVLAIVVVLGVVGGVLHRQNLRSVFGSIWAILVYIGLGLLVLLGIAFLLVGTMCGEGETGEGNEDGDGNGDGNNDGNGGDGGGNNGGNGGGGGNGGSGDGGGGGGGSQQGPGGGGGGVGDANPVQAPIDIDPSAFTWLLVALLVIAGVVALIVMLRFRTPGKGGKGAPALASQTLKARERKDMMRMLAQGRFAGADAVIAAYRTFVDWAGERGMGLRPDETSREHARRVAQKYEVPEGDVDGFVHAYEVARLSQHDPSDDQRELAVRFARSLSANREVKPE